MGGSGRSAAGYWGIQCDTKYVTFVKSAWRTDAEGVELEGDVQAGAPTGHLGFIHVAEYKV